MLIIEMGEPDLLALDLYRIAISENCPLSRRHALICSMRQMENWQLDGLAKSAYWQSGGIEGTNSFNRWMIESNAVRNKATVEISQIWERFAVRNGLKLSLAEHAGRLV